VATTEVQSAVDALRRAREAKLAEVRAIERALEVLGHPAADCLDRDFADCGIVEAAKRWLREQGKPRTTSEIASTIRERGVETKSKRFVPTVYATLHNAIQAGDPELVRNGKLWGLKGLSL